MRESPANPPSAIVEGRHTEKLVVFSIFGLFVFATLIALGTWQVHRYHYKLDLAAQIHERTDASAVAAPGPERWPRVTRSHDQYLHLKLTGHFLPGKQILVHGATKLGNGFWVMAPLQTTRGFIVLINRGFVPIGITDAPRYPVASPSGPLHFTGLLRMTEPGGGFLRPNRPAQNRWYSRDVVAIANHMDLPAHNVAPYFVDAATKPGSPAWPRGGMTHVSIYNHSLGYAVTWYTLAALALVGAWIVVRHEREYRRENA